MLLHNFLQDFKNLEKRVKALETSNQVSSISIPSTGYFVIKVVTSDPGSPKNGEIWINSTTNQLKWNDAGTVKAVTLS